MMINKIYKTTIYLTLFIVLLTGGSLASYSGSVVYAGNINSNEAKVIAVASGTFTYQGKVYRAYSDYVSELYGYLADDDIDLDAQQAQNAINIIYSNVKEGIDSEIIYEVKEPEVENNSDLDNMPADDTGEASRKSAENASDREVEALFKKIDENHKERKGYSDKLSATETDASIVISGDELIISKGNTDIRLHADERIIPKEYLSILVIISSVILGISVISLIILSLNKCMRIRSGDKKRPRKGHSRRRHLRKICRRTLTVSTAIGISFLFIIIAVVIGLYNNNKIFENIQNSGYFRYAYTEYLADVNLTQEADSENQNKEESVLPYDDFILKEKINIDTTLKSRDNLSEVSTDEEGITSKYSIAPYVRRMQIDVQPAITISAALIVLAIIISVFCNIFMDLRRDRGVRSISISMLTGTFITFVSAVMIKFINITDSLFVEPGYLYNFIADHIQWLTKVLFVIGLMGAVIGISLVGIYKNMRKDRN